MGCGPPSGGAALRPHTEGARVSQSSLLGKTHTLGLKQQASILPGREAGNPRSGCRQGQRALRGEAPRTRSAPGGPGSAGLHSVRLVSASPPRPCPVPPPSPVPHPTPSPRPPTRSPRPLTPEGVRRARQSPAPACSLAGRGRAGQGGAGGNLTTCSPSEAQGAPHPPGDSRSPASDATSAPRALKQN